MAENDARYDRPHAVTLWLDPVCPFSWNTARWLTASAEKASLEIDWRIMSLAVLNQDRQLPPAQQARMEDSRRVGRLMAALSDELGPGAFGKAYVAFAEQYFDRAAAVADGLADHVIRAVGAERTHADSLANTELDAVVATSHQASQDALGDTGGSPLLTINGHTIFGPVFTDVPTGDEALPLFDAVVTLVRSPQFSQLNRPRTHA